MKDEKKRTLYLKVRVSPEEMAAIKKKFENSGMSSLSTFVRAMIFEGYIAQVNENELKELTRIANNVANNINQIATEQMSRTRFIRKILRKSRALPVRSLTLCFFCKRRSCS